MFDYKFKSVLSALVIGLGFLGLASQASAVESRISVDKSALIMNKGSVETITFALSEPVICQNVDLPCSVSLDYSSMLPSGVLMSPSTVTWLSSEWSQKRIVTFRLTENYDFSSEVNLNLTAIAESNSEYYQGFERSIALSVPAVVVEPTEPPVEVEPTPSPTPKQTLADTGIESSMYPLGALGLLMLLAGLWITRKISARSRAL